MVSHDNLLIDKLTYQAQVSARLENWEECYKYIEEAIKMKKDDITNFQLILLEDTANNILLKKYSQIEYTVNLEKIERNKKGSLLVYIIDELKHSAIREMQDFIDKILKLIDNFLLKKSDLRDYHKAYYNKIRGDYYFYQEILNTEFLKQNLIMTSQKFSSQKTNNNLSSNLHQAEKDFLTLAGSFYKTAYEEFFIGEKRLFEPGCQFSFRVGLSYSWFLFSLLNNKQEAIEILKNLFEMRVLDDKNLGIEEYKKIYQNNLLVEDLLGKILQV